MKKYIPALALFFLFQFVPLASAQIEANSKGSTHAKEQEKKDISYVDALVLGVVEGVTEYLPVSSTGHLILANSFLELESDEPIFTKKGKPIFDKNGEPYTMKALADAYAIVIQFGAILAVAFIYRSDIIKIFLGIFGKNAAGLKLFSNLITAFLPAAVIGLILADFIEKHLFDVYPVIFALAAGSVLMFVVQKIYDKRMKNSESFGTIDQMTFKQSLLVGMLQCLAMWPGTSRSMMTILGGYIAGLRASDAAKFSFLLGLLTLSAASFYKTMKDGYAMFELLSCGPILVGLVVAFVSAAISVKWLVNFLTKHGMIPFALYRIVIAIAIFLLIYFDVK